MMLKRFTYPALKPYLPYVLGLLFVFITSVGFTQGVESIGSTIHNFRNPSLGLNGGINLSTNFYSANNIDPRRDNLQWLANIHLNLSFGAISAPFSFTFSDGNQQFNLPSYTFTGISPTYKWATLHAGDRSMYFSKYTLSGINFRGGGVELEPGKFRFKAMYGRLTKAVAEDLNARQSLDPAYQRNGYSMLAGYQGNDFEVNAIIFGAKDDENSIANPINFDVTPSENVVASLKARKAFGNKLIVDAEFARSGFNSDLRTEEAPDFFGGAGESFLGLFTPKESSVFGNAFNTGITFNQSKYTLRLGYEKIDRGFKTLGSLFFNSDLVHYTASVATRLLKNKISLALRGGLEETNRQDLTKPTNSRLVASVNATYNPGKKFLFSASFSNFDNSTKIRARENPNAFVDSLFLAQLTQTYTFSTTYKIKEKYNPMTLTAVLSHQSANSVQDEVVQEDSKSKFNNASLILNQRITESDFTWTTSLNFNRSDFANLSTTTISPSVILNKGLFQKKLNTSLRLTYNLVSLEGGNNSNVLNLGWNNNWAFLKNHILGLSLNYNNRSGTGGEGLGDFSELYGRLYYNYQFASSIRDDN